MTQPLGQQELVASLDTDRILHAPDGPDYSRRRYHARCDPTARPTPILCPWCQQYSGPSPQLTEARRILTGLDGQEPR